MNKLIYNLAWHEYDTIKDVLFHDRIPKIMQEKTHKHVIQVMSSRIASRM